MDRIHPTDINTLIDISNERCVSIYLPTHTETQAQPQDPILLKNLIQEAREQLSKSGMRTPDIQSLLKAAEDLLNNRLFWQHQSEGLAIFLAQGFFRSYRLPLKFPKLLTISNHFQIKPLLPLLSRDGQFYILALSINQIRLFLATRDSIDEIELQDVPTSMQEALYMDDPEQHLDMHSSSRAAGANAPDAMFHGQGGKQDQEKINLLRYFQYVDQRLIHVLRENDIPMILAGVDYLLPIYREANSYPNIIDLDLTGNPDELSAGQLHEQALKKITPRFLDEQQTALSKFKQLYGQENKLATTDLETIVFAAHHGRVETLFVPRDIQKWGQIDLAQHKMSLDIQPTLENVDVLDRAAVKTLTHGGTVYALAEEDMPLSAELAAIMRYTTS